MVVDFNERPQTVVWEMTRAAAITCAHCGDGFRGGPDAHELTTSEALQLVGRVSESGAWSLVLAGSDPFVRSDLEEIVGHASERGLAVQVSSLISTLATPARLASLRAAGVLAVQVALDGVPTRAHGAVRGSPHALHPSLRLLDDLRTAGIAANVRTTLTRERVRELPCILKEVRTFGVETWTLYFPVRAQHPHRRQVLEPALTYHVLDWMCEVNARAYMTVDAAAAPQIAAIAALRVESASPVVGAMGDAPPSRPGPADPVARSLGKSALNDGKGFAFIDHHGNICPSGFIHRAAGNIRADSLAEVYRHSVLFRQLRDPELLTGRCGRCRFAELCGGSRARAYAMNGSYFADDPLCPGLGSRPAAAAKTASVT